MKLKTTLGNITSFFYAGGQTIAEMMDTFNSITLLGAGKASAPIAFATAIMTGAIEFTTSYFFQGAEIRKRIKDTEGYSAEHDARLEEILSRASPSRKRSYCGIKLSFVPITITMDYLRVCLLFSATKAYIITFTTDEDMALAPITGTEGGLIALYFGLFDLPFILSGEILQTLKGIREMLEVPEDGLPDHKVMNRILNVVKPIAGNKICRLLISVPGSAADTLEHVGPLALVVQPTWIRAIANSHPAIAFGALGVGTFCLAVITVTIFTQTYLFEGKYCEQNLKKIAGQLEEGEQKERWIHPLIAKYFHYLLYLGGPLHGVDTGISVLVSLREYNVYKPLVIPISTAFFINAWIGNHFSEVMESQDELKRIKIEAEPREQDFASLLRATPFRHLFFKQPRDYGNLQPLDSRPVPWGLSNIDLEEDAPLPRNPETENHSSWLPRSFLGTHG